MLLAGVQTLVGRAREDFGGPDTPRQPQGAAVKGEFPVAATSSPGSVRVLSANMWGVPTSPLVRKRLRTLGAVLADYDLIALQEVWHVRDRALVRELAADAGLTYTHAFCHGSGMAVWPGQHGTGLMIISRWPIVDVAYHRFSVTGRPYAFHQADYYGAKGIGWVRVASPHGLIDVFDTHLVAQYSADPHDEYSKTRLGQAFEHASFVSSVAGSTPFGGAGYVLPDGSRAVGPVILVVDMGDFNAPPNSLVVAAVHHLCGLRDAYAESDDGRAGKPGFTGEGPTGEAQRMDYIFYAYAPHQPWLLEYARPLDDLVVPGEQPAVPVSDHAPVAASFRLVDSSTLLPLPLPQLPAAGTRDQTLTELVAEIEAGVVEIAARRNRHKLRFWRALAGLVAILLLSLFVSSRYAYTVVAIATYGSSAGQLFGGLLVQALSIGLVSVLPLMFMAVVLAGYVCVEFFLAWYTRGW
ncbi:sphingomyelin phosphodiesterase 2 [Thecamonas trahens ATCC 50062]|uniref:Sphingomyelin phosphodiesterase 2 n=1 Tax=Thecamonas trahens ATCC 50062 TaxID=461836 RepID=A0A0L0DJ24_THETB|nr:sphingomyelin phosphodiesterase 2 [Thecamonas trahens ATCC 50062]KNC51333.1 sphingomyelin phosphodiesterase 2 [Thecamonas trahens ATCC 50062]|eukprot:XP_013756253.1 sphingomyelin phosphodiesterase 2 [Thecamonas trahens ATCC 50062]